jgi:hypothetical protein
VDSKLATRCWWCRPTSRPSWPRRGAGGGGGVAQRQPARRRAAARRASSALLRGFNQEQATLRLAVRGVAPAALQAVQVEERDLADPARAPRSWPAWCRSSC